MQCLPFSSSSSARPAGLGPVFPGLRRPLPKTRAAGLAWALAPLAACCMLMAADAATTARAARATQRLNEVAAGTVAGTDPAAPAIPPVKLATGTLRVAPRTDKAALTLALSVEFPTAGAQYTPGTGDNDNTYTTQREYLGYYDAESCYIYIDNPQEAIPAPYTKADYKRFKRSGPAYWHGCDDAFSGNFLNWASSSAIDMLRLALSGGDRYIDTPDLTILQRAVLPSGPPEHMCMWNNKYFPAKILRRDGGGYRRYWRAIPRALFKGIDSDIYVANKWNRIYLNFGNRSGRKCTDKRYWNDEYDSDYTGDYTFGFDYGSDAIDGGDRSRGPVQYLRWNDRPIHAQWCADENHRGGASNYCKFSGVMEVWYGWEDYASGYMVAPAANGIACSNGAFGADPEPGRRKSCWIRYYDGTWSNTNPPAQLPDWAFNSDRFFFARVQVCDSVSGELTDKRNYDFCQRYPNGKYKPAGVIQKYADKTRLAAFGYLLDQSSSRYGGVLRAPMKYVGHRTYDINGIDNTPAGGNPGAEWDAHTGVFRSNPDNMTADRDGKWPAVSGVINYLNKFGRSEAVGRYVGHDLYGTYKDNDPLGELHYEALRYLQGHSPTPAAIGGVTADMTDKFPYYDIWSDPYGGGRSAGGDYSCLKSSIVVIGDAHTHDSGRLPAASAANNIPDINYWRGKVQAFEGNPVGSYPDANGIDRPISNPNPANNDVPADSLGSQIMGTAYWARTHDIRGSDWTARPDLQRRGLRVKTIAFDVNEQGKQNVQEVRRRSNQLFMAAKYGGFETDSENPGGKPYNDRGNPFYDRRGQTNATPLGRANNKVWEKAGDFDEAASYYFYDGNKDSPARAALSAFDEIFRPEVTNPQGMAASSLSTGSQLTSNTVIYTAKFDTGDWSGDIVAKPVSSNASAGNSVVVGADLWSAAQRLDAKPWAERNIFVGKVADNSLTRSSGNAATRFVLNEMEDSLKAQLDRPAPGAASDGYGTWRTTYLRGEPSQSGDPFRKRKSVLGDIINSNISYSGAPRKRIEGAGYAAFYRKYTSPARAPAVFAGANDGMLHAFDAASGEERFAYIPGWMGPKLSALTDIDYINHHQSYVDGPSVVSEARTGSEDATAEDWKTVLVSGTGGGGSGVFALDVSDPVNFSAANVMWEFTRADDPNIGEVAGAPKIMKIKTANATATEAAKYRWFAVVAGGVNNYVPDGAGRVSTSGKPALFLLALDKALGIPWSLGDNYYRVDIPVDATLSSTQAPGVLNFSALYGSQGEMTDLYFGDLHGQVWRLQFAGKAPADWSNMDRLSFFKKTGAAAAKPLFLARTIDTSTGTPPTIKAQPISAAPTLFVGPRVKGRETFHVLFGTGKYLEASDNTTIGKQSVYALFDNGDPAASTPNTLEGDAAVITSRLHLRRANVDQANKKITVDPFLWGYPKALSMSEKLANLNGDLPADPDSATTPHPGWYFDLPESEERVDQPGRDLGALTVAINSKIPTAPAAGASCGNGVATGGGNEYVLNVNTGAADYSASTVGLLGAPMFLSNSVETVTGARDSANRAIALTTHRRWSQGQNASQAGDSANSATGKVKTPQFIGRLSWRKISNYQELRHSQPAGAAARPPAGAASSTNR